MFVCRLALSLGKTIQELSDTISYPEFQIWTQYYIQEPFGPFADEYRHGRMMALYANCHSSKRRFTAEEFMHSVDRQNHEQTEEEKVAVFRSAISALQQMKAK